MPEGAPTSALGERSGAPSGLRPSSFVMCNTPVEVQFMTSAGCLNYPCRTPDRVGARWFGRVAPDAAGERFGAAGRRVELSRSRGSVFVERRHDPWLAQTV